MRRWKFIFVAIAADMLAQEYAQHGAFLHVLSDSSDIFWSQISRSKYGVKGLSAWQ